MQLKLQKRLAAQLTKRSPKKISFDTDRMDEIKEAITKADIRGLINDGAIVAGQRRGTSRVRARKIHIQKSKGKRRGVGSRRGVASARLDSRRLWINQIRLQRKLLSTLKSKELIQPADYADLYKKSKGGFFRNIRHLKLYIEERGIIKK